MIDEQILLTEHFAFIEDLDDLAAIVEKYPEGDFTEKDGKICYRFMIEVVQPKQDVYETNRKGY